MRTYRRIVEGEEPIISERPKKDIILATLYKRYAEEILQWYHYWTVAPFLVGEERPNIEKSFKEFADDELNDHAARLLSRIEELDGDIEMLKNIESLKALSDCKYAVPMQPYSTTQLVIMNIEHEQCAINGYKELCELTHIVDPVTYDMAVDILKDEEEHLTELKNFLADQNIK